HRPVAFRQLARRAAVDAAAGQVLGVGPLLFPERAASDERARALDDVEHLRLALVHRRRRRHVCDAILEVRVLWREPNHWLDEVRLVRLPFALRLRDHRGHVGRSREQLRRRGRRCWGGRLLGQRRRGEQRENRANHSCAHEGLLSSGFYRQRRRYFAARTSILLISGACASRSGALAISAAATRPDRRACRPQSSSNVSKMPKVDCPSRTANQSTVAGSSCTMARPPLRNCSTSASLPGLASSRTHNATFTMPPPSSSSAT